MRPHNITTEPSGSSRPVANPAKSGATNPDWTAVAKCKTSPARTARSGNTLVRFGLALAALSVFIGVASVIKPPPRSASAGNPTVSGLPPVGQPTRASAASGHLLPAALAGLAHPQGWPLLGILDGAEHRVLCYGSPDGPRYTVCALDGKVLQADLPADEVYRAFPEIDLETMRDDPSGPRGSTPLMLAE